MHSLWVLLHIHEATPQRLAPQSTSGFSCSSGYVRLWVHCWTAHLWLVFEAAQLEGGVQTTDYIMDIINILWILWLLIREMCRLLWQTHRNSENLTFFNTNERLNWRMNEWTDVETSWENLVFFLGSKSKEEREEEKIPQLWNGEEIIIRSDAHGLDLKCRTIQQYFQMGTCFVL